MQPRPIAGSRRRLCGPELLLGVVRGAVVLFIEQQDVAVGVLVPTHAQATRARSDPRSRASPLRWPVTHRAPLAAACSLRRRRSVTPALPDPGWHMGALTTSRRDHAHRRRSGPAADS